MEFDRQKSSLVRQTHAPKLRGLAGRVSADCLVVRVSEGCWYAVSRQVTSHPKKTCHVFSQT